MEPTRATPTHRDKPVLLTGHLGYLGAVMGPHLASRGWDVRGLDVGYFADCTIEDQPPPVPGVRKDLRDLVPEDLAGFGSVIHLGALSNDPIGNLDERWTGQINHDATVRLAELAREAGVERFVFSSSCIMYGMSEAEVVDETAPLDPQTVYARSKVTAERALRELATDTFSPTFIRNGTVYGMSPKMRLDTVLNDLVAQAVTTGKVVVFSDGKPWRPVVHVQDIARTFELYLSSPRELVHNEAFNNGADHLNHQVRDLARVATEAVPGSTMEIRDNSGADRRTYKADFGKFARTFPDFRFQFDAADGARQLAAAYKRVGLTVEDHQGASYVRLRWLNKLMQEGRLGADLRWTEDA